MPGPSSPAAPPAVVPAARSEGPATPAGALSITALAGVELALTAVEFAWVAAPVGAVARALGLHFQGVRALVALAAALWLASFLRLVDALGPVGVVAEARKRKATIPSADTEVALRALGRMPIESGALRFLSWLALAGLATFLSGSADGWLSGGVGPPPSSSWQALAGLGGVVVLHAAGAGALRALVLGDWLGRLRGLVSPTAEGLRLFARDYRGWLALLGLATVGLAHLLFLALGMSLAGVPPETRLTVLLFLWPILLPGGGLWLRSLYRRVRDIEVYFDATMRSPGTRGPARDEPRAVAAFRAAQSLPYRLAGYEAFVLLLAGVAAVATARRLLPLPLPAAVGLLLALGLVVVLSWLYVIVLGRRILAPLVRHLGSRHALPVAEIRSRVGLGAKLEVVFLVVGLGAAALVVLMAGAPPGHIGWALAGGTGAGAALLGLILLVTRGVVGPIHALEARSEEMARGELARPLPPSGEADEIGRLAVVFEEMRRALRDRLRSTESINIDLEREVRRRTEALEQRNVELREALEKLHRAQDNLVRSEKLASMGRLVAGIAHEINNPVNAVINSLGPLEETVRQLAQMAHETDAELGGSAEEMMAVVKRGAARTKAIVQALHNYSRGDDAIQREVNLERSIEDSLDLLRHRLRDVKIVKEVTPGVRIRGLPGQIDQVLMNLITNAAQAIGDRGGTITVTAHPKTEGVEITVTDDGPGIPPDIRARIFDPFFTTKDVGEGSGLGLSIVHGIIERHGGRIDVDSTVGKGTTFKVMLPYAPYRATAT
jgi:signal transduction histidine kinase